MGRERMALPMYVQVIYVPLGRPFDEVMMGT
jgi:hypothetical protein